MNKTAQIIDDMGGTAFVARKLDISPSTVSMWKRNNSIPAWRRFKLRDLADELGIERPVFKK